MQSEIKIIMEDRLRQIPCRFSWLDQRLVRDNHLRNLSTEAATLYLFLSCVADNRGMSFYSDGAIDQRLQLKSLLVARNELMRVDLIAYHEPYYQVLSLDRISPPAPVTVPIVMPAPVTLGQRKRSKILANGDRKMEPDELKSSIDEFMRSFRR